MRRAPLVRTVRIAFLVIACTALAYSGTVRAFPSSLPLGTEAIVLHPAEAVVHVIVSAQSPDFEGLRLVSDGRRARVVAADGRRLTTFPARVDFRVTVSLAPEQDLGYEPFPIETDIDTDSYLRALTFRARLFRGLEYRVLEPAVVRMIGVPSDVPSPYRTYRVSFELKDVSVEERLLFDVIAPDGQRIARFYLPLN